MTVSATESRERYTGNGVTTDFPINFSFGANSEINATEITDLGAEIPWVLDGAGATGFTILDSTLIANVALTDGSDIVIYRETPLTQGVDYVPNRATPAEVTEGTIDKLTRMVQEQADASARSMRLPVIAETSVSTVLPLPEALNLIRWNTAANAFENVTSAELSGEGMASNFVADNYVDGVDFTAGVTTQLVLTSVPGTENNTQIYFDGVYQEKGTYALVDSTITFDAPIPGGVGGVEIMYVVGAPPSVPADASVTTPKIALQAVINSRLGNGAVTTLKLGGIDTIAEETPDNGVQIDDVDCKDGGINLINPLTLTGTFPKIRLTETDQVADAKVWEVVLDESDFVIRTLTDALGGAVEAISIERTGTAITAINFKAATQKMDVIDELTPAAGVTVAGCLMQAGSAALADVATAVPANSIGATEINWPSSEASRTVNTGTSWVMTAGIYTAVWQKAGTPGDLLLEALIDSAWRVVLADIGTTAWGSVYSDGTNMRVRNGGGGNVDLYYRLMDA